MLEFVLNFLFPPVCGICGKKNKNWICEKCKTKLEKFEKNKYIKNELKKNCTNLEHIFFDEFFYIFEYKKIIRELILRYKFGEKPYLSNMFAGIILNNKKVETILKSYDIIVSVPMDSKKKNERGYNQTELITNIILKKGNILVENRVLYKNKYTKTQSTLSLDERYENIKNAFLVKNAEKIKNKKVIVFDDIYTTGATVNEISKLLKKAGAQKILVLVIARV